MAPVLRAVVLLLPLLALSGCASASTGTGAGTVVDPAARASGSSEASLAPEPSATPGSTGAAGRIVRCSGPVVGETRSAPYDGEDTGATPDAALAAAKQWVRWDGAQEGFALARVEPSRRLYVLEVGGVAKQALIVRRGPALKGDGTAATVTRWWLESWARCDYAELPEAVARRQGLELWTGPDGKRALTSAIESFAFDDGCLPGLRALDVGGPLAGGRERAGEAAVEYLQHPPAELRGRYVDREYVEHATVPADAIDSGYEREGEHLWFSADRGFAYVGEPADAQAWPRAKQPVRCA